MAFQSTWQEENGLLLFKVFFCLFVVGEEVLFLIFFFQNLFFFGAIFLFSFSFFLILLSLSSLLISLIFPSQKKDDIYLRFQSYSEVGEWKNSILEKNPIKIDIGPVYSLPPKNRSNYEPTSFQPLERELIFDIDMDEYNRLVFSFFFWFFFWFCLSLFLFYFFRFFH